VTTAVDPELAALESRAKAIRVAAGTLLYSDAFERWGPKDEFERTMAIADAAAEAERTKAAAVAWIIQRVTELRATAPERVARWADAHVELLDDYLGRVAADTTEAHVARQEREQWLELRAGQRDRVDQNGYYVRYDDARYRAWFGFGYR
jgi:hypothetical protein